MTKQKNDSRTILKIEVTNKSKLIEINAKGLEKGIVQDTLATVIERCSKDDKTFAQAILMGLVEDCGITEEDFKVIKKVQNDKPNIDEFLTKIFGNKNESGGQNG